MPDSEAATPIRLEQPALLDTGVWTWARDRRFPQLAEWFNDLARTGTILVCDLIRLELVRLAANEQRAAKIGARLDAFEAVEMPAGLWRRARELQLALAPSGDHRRVRPADLLIAAAAEQAGVPLVHYDRDYPRIAAVSNLDQRWFVPEGTLSSNGE